MAKRTAEQFHPNKVRVILSSEEILQQQGRSERRKLIARRRQDDMRILKRKVKEHETAVRRYCKQTEDWQSELDRMGMQQQQLKIYYESRLKSVRREYEPETDDLANAEFQDTAKWSKEVLARLFWETREELQKTRAELNSVKGKLVIAEGIIDGYNAHSEVDSELESQSSPATRWTTGQSRFRERPVDPYGTLRLGSGDVGVPSRSEERTRTNLGKGRSTSSESNRILLAQIDGVCLGSGPSVVEPSRDEQYAPAVLETANSKQISQQYLRDVSLRQPGPKIPDTDSVSKTGGLQETPPISTSLDPSSILELTASAKVQSPAPTYSSYVSETALSLPGTGVKEEISPVGASTLLIKRLGSPSLVLMNLTLQEKEQALGHAETSDIVMMLAPPATGPMTTDSDSGIALPTADSNSMTTASLSSNQFTRTCLLLSNRQLSKLPSLPESLQPVLSPAWNLSYSIPPVINDISSIGAGRRRTKLCMDDGSDNNK
ncbi:hypothetical protein AAF712_008516 [Marasmius tenuissimus]|uniref:Uncharacterized protein n=1 Tax=Marasmius tenuissimus TaxID=585030 RepID=A0ABR2ZSL1_9AGAR